MASTEEEPKFTSTTVNLRRAFLGRPSAGVPARERSRRSGASQCDAGRARPTTHSRRTGSARTGLSRLVLGPDVQLGGNPQAQEIDCAVGANENFVEHVGRVADPEEGGPYRWLRKVVCARGWRCRVSFPSKSFIKY